LSAELPNLKTFVTLSPIPTLTRWMAEQGIDPNGLDDDGLKAAAAQFLLTAKRDDGMPYDPVARFHLGNGAYVHAVHAGADMSSKGLSESAGAMVNYRYEAESFAENHERFVGQKEVVASKAVRALVKAPVAA
ncbi:MAG: malonyl-CoA decarboxylase family protein, partial [Rhodobacteraceae bacterium]|nr:malonyl-CoA decarboxylase family protein [Paracoccaceae bacterium]